MRKPTLVQALLALVAISVLPQSTLATRGVLIADNPAIDHKGDPPDRVGNDLYFRCDTAAAIFTFTGIKTPIPGTHVLVKFNLRVTNHLNGDAGLDGLVDITINPGKDAKHTYTLTEVLLDNLDPTNKVFAWDKTGGTYSSEAGILVHNDYIQGGTLTIQMDRHVDSNCNFSPTAPNQIQSPIDMSTCPPALPSGCYEDDDAHTVHIGVTSTNGTRADNGVVTIWAVPSWEVIADSPTMDWTNKVDPPDRVGPVLWFRDPNTGVQLTFTGIDTEAILGTHVLVNFNLYVTNRADGDAGLDGLLEISVNPKETNPKLRYTLGEVLFDNIDSSNVLVHWGKPGGTYETRAGILVHKDYIQNGKLELQLTRRQKGTVDRTAENGTQQPIDMSKCPPTVPLGIYGNNDAHTVHVGIHSADDVHVDPGHVVILAEPPPPPLPPTLCNETGTNAGCWSGCDTDTCDADCEELPENLELVEETNFLPVHLALVQAESKINLFQKAVHEVLAKQNPPPKEVVKITDVQDAIDAIIADYDAQGAGHVTIFGHASPGHFKIGEDDLAEFQDKFIEAIREKIKSLTLYGCQVSQGTDGQAFLKKLTEGLKRPVHTWDGKVYAFPNKWPDGSAVPPELANKFFIEDDTDKKEIPAVTEWGMVVMVLLVLAAGTVVIRRVRAGTVQM